MYDKSIQYFNKLCSKNIFIFKYHSEKCCKIANSNFGNISEVELDAT